MLHHSNEPNQEVILITSHLPSRITTNTSSTPQMSNQNVFSILLKNKRQITSLTAGLVVLLGSGVHIVWAFWEIFSATSWLEEEVIGTIASWYIANVIGSVGAAILIPKWSKKHIYILSAFILLLSSLLFTSRLSTVFRNDSILIMGRFLGGLANGLAYVTVVTHAAENAVNEIRGLILRVVGYVLAFSLFIAGVTTNGTIENDINSEVMMGFLNLFYSLVGIALAPFLTIESVPHLLQKTRDGTIGEREALDTMVKLRNEKEQTPKIRDDFVEMKHHLNEDKLESRNPFNRKNLRPLLCITGVRVLSVCAKNLPFTILIMGFFNHLCSSKTYSVYMLFLLLSCRFIFGMATMFFIDKFERKKYLYIFSILCGTLLLSTCCVVSRTKEDFFQFSKTGLAMIIFFVFASMSIDVLGHVQTAEAFSYATKCQSIVIATSVEHIVHIIFIIIFKLQYDVYAFALIAIGLIIMGSSTLLTVPAKTKGLSLRQTRDIYRNVRFVSPLEPFL